MSDIAARVKKIVVEHLGVDADKVKAEASFIDDLGAELLALQAVQTRHELQGDPVARRDLGATQRAVPDHAGAQERCRVEVVEHDRRVADIVADGHDLATVSHIERLLRRAEYKRRQYPPGPKVSRRAFGKDRRLPMTSHWREL